MTINNILALLGNPGCHAKVIFLMMCLNYIPVAFNHLAMSVFGASPPHRCTLPPGVPYTNVSVPVDKTGQLDSCKVYVNYSSQGGQTEDCPHGWTFTPIQTEIPGAPDESTVVDEWDLVCSSRWLVSLATTLYFAGVLAGGVSFGAAADSLGRRPVMLFTLFSPVVLGVMLFFVQNFTLFILIRVVIGMMMQGLQSTAYVLGMELFYDDRHRAVSTALFECTWALGVMTLALFAWTLKAWRWIQLAFSLVTLLSIPWIWFIPESFRWMYNKRKYDSCQKYLIHVAKFNKVTLPEKHTTQLQQLAENDEIKEETRKKYHFFHIFSTKTLAKRSLIMFYVWFATSCSYYGLSLNASRLAGNRYLNYFINGAIEFPAYLLGVWILPKIGRRLPLTVYFLIGGVSLIIAGTIPKSTGGGADIAWLSTLLAWVGKFSTAGCWSVVFLYASELFPTGLRNVAVGACASCARVGSLVAPQILLLGRETEAWVTPVILGIIALLGGLATLALPETRGKQLPDTLAQAEHLQDLEQAGQDEAGGQDGVGGQEQEDRTSL